MTATAVERRELGAFDYGCVVVGGIIGVGIFFTPAKVAERAGDAGAVLAVWGLGGLLAVLGALVFAELSVRVPGHGGIFRYIDAAFGRLPAFLYGWSNWLVIQAGALGVVALLCVDHLERACFGATRSSLHVRVLVAAAVILVFTATNVLGLRVGKRVQNALTVLKVLALGFLVVVAGLATGHAPAAAGRAAVDAEPLAARLAGALLPVLFAIGGWQQGSFLAGAARRPRRDVPLGILAGVAVVVAVYMAINVAYLELLGIDGAAASSAIGADAARQALGPGGERVLAAIVALSAAGIMNTICMAPPYVLLAMAEAGLFPRRFAHRHARWGTPVWGVLGQGLWAAVLLLLVHGAASLGAAGSAPRTIDTLGFVCDGVVFVDWLFFALCGLALLRLRSRDAGLGGFALPLGWLAAGAFALGAAAVTVGAVATNAWPSFAGGALAALGLLAWPALRGRRPI